MGTVLEATQISLSRRVALKALHPHLAFSARSIERFRSEATAAARLRHPAIVPIHEVGEVDGLHYFSMDFFEGEPLSEWLVRDDLGSHVQGRAAFAAKVVAEVAEALQFAHDRGIVHRDVKPHNLLTGDGSVRLLDFGLAKMLDQRARPRADPAPPGRARVLVSTHHGFSSPSTCSTPRTARSSALANGTADPFCSLLREGQVARAAEP